LDSYFCLFRLPRYFDVYACFWLDNHLDFTLPDGALPLRFPRPDHRRTDRVLHLGPVQCRPPIVPASRNLPWHCWCEYPLRHEHTTTISGWPSDDTRQHARQRRAVTGRVLLAVPPPDDPERRPLARSPVLTFGPRMVCTRCGIIGADARPNWREQPARLSGAGTAPWR
jgi:hypothetical protein